MLDLVLLRLEVLLVGVGHRLVLAQLVAGVDPVGRDHAGRQHQPQPEGARPAAPQDPREDVGGVGPEVGPHVVGLRAEGDLGQVLDELGLGVAPGEVGVALGEADLGQAGHQLGPGERLGQEDDLRVGGLDLPDAPLPERERLRVGVVDPEDADAVADPEVQDLLAGLPQGPAVGGVGRPHVERVDVLVLLRGVLGVLDRAVGPVVEPLRVLLDPGVVRRALEGVVEGHLHPEAPRPGPEGVEVGEAAELGVERRVAALGRADGPGAARVARAGLQRVVAALTEGPADRVDGRQVDHVEAHVGHGRQPVGGAGQSAVGAGEQLVPGAVEGALPVDPQRHRRCLGQVGGVGQLVEERHQRRVEGAGEARLGRGLGVAERLDGRLEPGPVGPVDPGEGAFQEAGPLLELDLHRLAGGELHGDLVAPGGDPVGPALDHELVGAELGRLDDRLVAVVAERAHQRRRPFPLAVAPAAPADPGGQDVVPVPEDVGGDGHGPPHHRLGRISAGRRRADAFDDNSIGHVVLVYHSSPEANALRLMDPSRLGSVLRL